MEKLARVQFLEPDMKQWRESGVLTFAADANPTLQTILDWCEQHRAQRAQLEEALARPQSQLSTDRLYPFASDLPNFVAFRAIAQYYGSLCKVHLLMGDADAALHDLQMLRRSMDSIQANDPPTLVEAMIKVAIAGLFATTLEETLAEGLWPDTHIVRVQSWCGVADLHGDVTLSLRGGERAAILREIDTRIKKGKATGLAEFANAFAGIWKDSQPDFVTLLLWLAVPEGWVDQNKASYARIMQRLLPGPDGRNQGLDARSQRALEESHPYTILPLLGIPNFVKASASTLKNNTMLNLTFVACTLELHRVAKGAYPDTLAALVPEFAAKLPNDIYDGQPLRYRRTDDGKYVLYSIGPNLKDEGGKPDEIVTDARGVTSTKSHDTVWKGVPKK